MSQEIKDAHRRAVATALKRASEEARGELANSNCVDEAVCTAAPCMCARAAVVSSVKVLLDEIMIWNGGVLPDDRMEIGDIAAVLEAVK